LDRTIKKNKTYRPSFLKASKKFKLGKAFKKDLKRIQKDKNLILELSEQTLSGENSISLELKFKKGKFILEYFCYEMVVNHMKDDHYHEFKTVKKLKEHLDRLLNTTETYA